MRLKPRLEALERSSGSLEWRGPVILFAPSHLPQEQALAEHEAKHGPVTREPLFVALVGPNE